MRIKSLVFLLIFSLNFSGLFAAYNHEKKTEKNISYKKGELLVKLKPNIDVHSFFNSSPAQNLTRKYKISGPKPMFDSKNKKFRGTSIHAQKIFQWQKISVPQDVNLMQLIEEYKKLPEVETIELNRQYDLFNTTPNDPLFHLQWALNNSGQPHPIPGGSYSGTAGADINAPEAWDATVGSSSTVIAVIDTGVDYQHPDLQGNIWTNTDEIPNNGIDDDGNGFIDDRIGWDFSDNDNDPADYMGHGTHCAGIIAAKGNNNLGVSGIDWSAKIMMVKVFPNAYDSTMADAIIYAANNGAKVLSDSWGSRYYSQIIQDAINYAYHVKGCVVVFAAGNNYDETTMYPAACSNVISVIATDSDDQRAYFSSHGTWCDVAAPGEDILSLRANGSDMYENGIHIVSNDYYVCSGTSMACPLVAGFAGLILSKYSSLSNSKVELMIKNNCDDLGLPGFDTEFAYGRINASKTLQSYANAGPLLFEHVSINDTLGNRDGVINPGETIQIKLKLKNPGGTAVSGVTSILSSTDSQIQSISDNSASFGTISGYSVKESLDNYVFRISATCPIGHVMHFKLEDTDSGTGSWTQYFDLTVSIYGPKIVYITNMMSDSQMIYPDNMPNNEVNPGEIISLNFILSNKGDQSAAMVRSTLNSTDANISILSSDVDYGNIPINGKTNSLDSCYFYVSSMAPDNYPAHFSLIIKDLNMNLWTNHFTMTIKHLKTPYISYLSSTVNDDNMGSSLGNNNGIVNAGETIELSVLALNKGTAGTNVSGLLKTSDPYVTISEATKNFGNIPSQSVASSLDEFVFSVNSSVPKNHTIPFSIAFQDNHGRAWTNAFNIGVFTPSGGSVLIVDKDYGWGEDYITYYTNALKANGTTYDVWTARNFNADIPLSVLQSYKTLLWFTGYNYTSTFSTGEQTNVAHYLANGGKLFLTGQDVGYNIGWTSFYQNYLHARFAADDVHLYKLNGVSGDPISSGLIPEISGAGGANNQTYPSEIDPIAPAQTIFTYNPQSTSLISFSNYAPSKKQSGLAGIVSSGAGGLKVDTGRYKVVYLSFGFEAINSDTTRNTLMQKVLDWLNATNTFMSENIYGTLLVDTFNDGSDPMAINSGSWIENINTITHNYQADSSGNSALGNSGYSLKIIHPDTGSSYIVMHLNRRVNCSNYTALSFWLKGKNGGETFRMDLGGEYDGEPPDATRLDIRNYLTNGVTTNWQKVIIPTWALHKDLNKNDVNRIVFDFTTYPAETIYIDDVTFNDKLAPCWINNFDDGTDPDAWGENLWSWADSGSGVYSPSYDAGNKIGSYGYGFKIGWNAGSSPYPNNSVTGMQILPRTWSPASTGQNLSICDKVSFYTKADASGIGKNIGIALYGDPGTEQEIVDNQSLTLTGAWQKVSRNTTNFKGIGRGNICGVEWWMSRQNICTNNNNFTFYLDRVMFEDTMAPLQPSGMKCNIRTIADGFNFNAKQNKIIATANSRRSDPSMEGVTVEWSTNGTKWYRTGTDYNTSDTSYSNIWDISGLRDGPLYSVKAVAMDTTGNSSELIYNNCSIGQLTITKSTDYNFSIAPGSSNIAVFAMKITDLLNHSIKEIKISNFGNMSNGPDIREMTLHYDKNLNNLYELSDGIIATAGWSTIGNCWKFTNLSVSSGSNLIITMDVSTNARMFNTFKGRIETGFVKCSGGALNTLVISNSGIISIKPHQMHIAKTGISPVPYKTKSSSSNIPVLAFTYQDNYSHKLEKLHVSRNGNMIQGRDIKTVKLWNEAGSTNGKFNGTEVFLSELAWDTTGKWTNNNLSIPANTSLLVTLNMESTLSNGTTFQAFLSSTNDIICSGGYCSSNIITNSGILTADTEPPSTSPFFKAVAGTNRIYLSWTNSSSPDFKYTIVRFKTNNFPTDNTDGLLAISKTTNPGSYSFYIHSPLVGGKTYYYSAFSLDDINNSSIPATNSVFLLYIDLPSLFSNNGTENQIDPKNEIPVGIKVHDISGISNVCLFYKGTSDTAFNSTVMSFNGTTYLATIPPQEKSGQVQYYIKALDLLGNYSMYPASAPTNTLNITVNPPKTTDLKIFNSFVDFSKGEDTAVCRYNVTSPGMVKIYIYSITGVLVRKLLETSHEPGTYDIAWNIKNSQDNNLPSGMYIISLQMNHSIINKKIMIVR